MTDDQRQKLRPIEFNAHQSYGRYWFHAWIVVDGETRALVEDERGQMSTLWAQGVKFLDPEPVPQMEWR